MIKLELYNGVKTYSSPAGDLLSPEVMNNKYGSINHFKHMITTDEHGEICYAVQLFSAMKAQLGIDDSLSDDDALQTMEDILNAPQPEPEPSAEERIAAAMEYQSMMM